MEKIFEYIQYFIHYDYSNIIFWYKIFAGLVSLLFIAGIAYAVWKTQEVFAALRGTDNPVSQPPRSTVSPKNILVWQKLITRVSSDNENERKLAIIAADSLIDKILELSGYRGENLGDRLKKIEPSDLDSLQDIWEAHKIRNRIAHEPDLHLSPEESMRALQRYEKVLKELRYL